MRSLLLFLPLLLACPAQRSEDGAGPQLCAIATQLLSARRTDPEPIEPGDLWALWPHVVADFQTTGGADDVTAALATVYEVEPESRWETLETALVSAGVSRFQCDAAKDILADEGPMGP